jgi:hypothetical protein
MTRKHEKDTPAPPADPTGQVLAHSWLALSRSRASTREHSHLRVAIVNSAHISSPYEVD